MRQGIWLATSSLLVSLSILGWVLPVNATIGTISIQPPPAPIYDLRGNQIKNATVGQTVVLSKNCTNNEAPARDVTFLFEVRDEDGITLYLAWQTTTIPFGSTKSVGISWTPESAGDYQFRAFVISNLTNPQVLDREITTAKLDVFE